jgi:hypothetical protein
MIANLSLTQIKTINNILILVSIFCTVIKDTILEYLALWAPPPSVLGKIEQPIIFSYRIRAYGLGHPCGER